MSTGFSWGSKPLSESVETNPLNASVPRYSPTLKSLTQPSSNINTTHNHISKKRKHHDEEAKSKSNNIHRKNLTPSLPSSSSSASSLPFKHKKPKTLRISGTPLPVSRLIEALDHKSLQNLLDNLIKTDPELAFTIQKLSPKPTLKSSIQLIKEKFENINSHFPYKCDTESDYSYLRIKPHLTEFLNCASDFILNILPPIETNISVSIEFLDIITNLIHDLPNFSNNEFQYTKLMAYEQIANTWLIVLSQRFQQDDASSQVHDESAELSSSNYESSAELIKIIEELNLQEVVQTHDEKSMGKFKLVIDFIKSELDNYEQINQSLNNGTSSNSINDLITVDYSNFSLSARTSH